MQSLFTVLVLSFWISKWIWWDNFRYLSFNTEIEISWMSLILLRWIRKKNYVFPLWNVCLENIWTNFVMKSLNYWIVWINFPCEFWLVISFIPLLSNIDEIIIIELFELRSIMIELNNNEHFHIHQMNL